MQLKLPELGEGVHEGELVKWRVKPGDTVKDDQPICEIMTDKATVEMPSPFHGKITELHAKVGEVIKIGQAILSYEGTAKSARGVPEKPSAPAPAAQPRQNGSTAAAASFTAVVAPIIAATPATTAAPLVMAAPSIRRLAREMGIDLARITGTGPAGRVMREDVEQARPGRPPAQISQKISHGGEERVPFIGLRKKIAEKMRLSKDKAAHFTYVEEADATALVELRNQAKEWGAQHGVKITYLPFVMKAMVAALRDFPMLNSTLNEEKNELIIKHYYNISLSVQTEDGLIAPVVHHVEDKSLLQLAQEIQALVDRARTKRLTMEDLTGGTITLTNAGSIGGLFATPVINYPEVAILGLNKIFRKPVVRASGGREEVAIRDWTYFSLSLDHRIIDGAVGAEFMKRFIKYIEAPSLLLLESYGR